MTTYWVRRAARGGTILAGGRHDQPIQLVHAADHGAFIVSLLQSKTTGVFNTVDPDDPATLGDLIDACVMAADVQPDAVVWATDQQLHDHNVTLPFVMPSNGRWDGNQRRSTTELEQPGSATGHWSRRRPRCSPGTEPTTKPAASQGRHPNARPRRSTRSRPADASTSGSDGDRHAALPAPPFRAAGWHRRREAVMNQHDEGFVSLFNGRDLTG